MACEGTPIEIGDFQWPAKRIWNGVPSGLAKFPGAQTWTVVDQELLEAIAGEDLHQSQSHT